VYNKEIFIIRKQGKKMAISTTDVITPANTGLDNISNGNAVVHVTQGGLTKILLTDSYVSNPTFSGVAAKYTNRFDEIAYYNTVSGIDGGT
jgi:hypothetical protein